MLLSIVIPTRNRPQSLEKCLEAIWQSARAASAVPDIHVADDGSSHSARIANKGLCRRFPAGYIFTEEAAGAAAARNAAARSCAGAWLAFIDDDVVVAPDWFESAQRWLAHLATDAVGVEGRVHASGNGVWDKEVENLNGGLYASCHMFYKASVFREAGGFDENFHGPYHEDHELAARMLQYGKIAFAPDLAATHLPRAIRLVPKIMSSPGSMSLLLDSELYFFLKQRDRYHLFRHARTFWGTYRAIAVRHLYTTLHRRPFARLVDHPLQSLALIIASAVEQVTAVALFFHLMKRYLSETAPVLHPHIDIARTFRHWNMSHTSTLALFRLERSRLRLGLFMARRAPVYDIRPALQNIRGAANPPPVLRIFLRVDDVFLRAGKEIEFFCAVMQKLRIPFLAAVTAADFADKNLSDRIRELVSCGASLAIHGFLHQGKFGPFDSEILQMTLPQIREKLAEMVFAGTAPELKPIAFVPPFNAVNAVQIRCLLQYFDIVCGGPETCRFTQRLIGPVFIKNGGIYFPSFYPFYGTSAGIAREFERSKNCLCGDICLTVHMAEEYQNGYSALCSLAESIRSYAAAWTTLVPDKKE